MLKLKIKNYTKDIRFLNLYIYRGTFWEILTLEKKEFLHVIPEVALSMELDNI